MIAVPLAFAALTVAHLALWAPRLSSSRSAAWWWTGPFTTALIAALVGGLIDARGVLALAVFGAACYLAGRGLRRALTVVSHAVMLTMAAGLLLHALPGFDNPQVVSGVMLSPDAVPYTKYLNFDKGVAGLFLLGLHAPSLPARDEGHRHVLAGAWRLAVVCAAVMALSIAFGYVHWDPKLPAWFATWLWSMVFLTALPEEAVFRGVAQTSVARWFHENPRADAIAIVTAGVLFGIAHVAGGPRYVVLAAVAGMGYGWVYASTRSIGAAVLAHSALNTVHVLLFTYPALRVA